MRVAHRPVRETFRAARSGEPLALDPRVNAFGLFTVPDACEYKAENVEDGIAVLCITGPLEHHRNWLFNSSEEIAEQLECALADGLVRAVVLKIDSPGGVAAGMDELHKRIRGLSEEHEKPIYAYVCEQACSAAYNIASACDEIWLPPSGEVGSVGVILCAVDETAALEKAGIKVRYVVTGARKADMHPGHPVTDDVLEVAQAKVDYLGDLFFRAVAEARGMTPIAVKNLEAGIFQGQRAVDVGFADGVSDWANFLGLVLETHAIGDTLSAEMSQGLARTTSNEGTSMKILALKKAAADAKAEVETARKALAKAPEDAAALARIEKALHSKIAADGALASAQAKTTTVKHIKHEEKVTEREEDEDAESDDEGEGEEAEAEDSDADSEISKSDGDSEEEAEAEKAIAKSFAVAPGADPLHNPRYLLRLAKQVTGQRSIKATFGALAGIGQRLAATEKLEKRLAKLETERRAEKVDAMLAAAESEGKITKAQVQGLREKGVQDRAFLKGFLASLPKAFRTTGEAFVPRADADGNPIGGVSSDEQKILASMVAGKSKEEADALTASFRDRLKTNGKSSTPSH